MKAVWFHEHGGPDKLVYEEVPDPKPPAADEILVRVKACGINYLDTDLRRGRPGMKMSLPHILGSDVAGEIAGVGAGVSGRAPGQRVLLHPGITDGQCLACAAGEDNMCSAFKVIGAHLPGGYAEYVTIPAVNAIPMPDNLAFEEAAAIPVVFATSWHMLVTRAGLKVGETVLVLAAGSGIGSAAVQIAKLFNCRVIATASTDEKLAKACELGADETINHSHQDLAAEVMRLTGGRGVDVVFEHVGSATWEKSINSLARNGRLVTSGATTGNEAQVTIRTLINRQLSLIGSFMGTRAELLSVMPYFGDGRLKPVLDRAMPLKEAAAAHALIDDRKQFGKVVLVP